MGQQSIEKGIFLQPNQKLVHACKVREDLGAGITRCGMTFLAGSFSYKPDATFGDPPREGSDGSWAQCGNCLKATSYEAHKRRWESWKGQLRQTLKFIQAACELSTAAVESLAGSVRDDLRNESQTPAP